MVLHVRRAEHTALRTLLPVHHARGPCQDPRLADCRTPCRQVSKALLMCCNTLNHYTVESIDFLVRGSIFVEFVATSHPRNNTPHELINYGYKVITFL